jgi:RNA polymerase sigma-70 factor (ECF subfamily)
VAQRRDLDREGRSGRLDLIWGIAIRRLVDVQRKQPSRDEVLVAEVPEPESDVADIALGFQHGDLGAALERLSPELLAVLQATVLDGLSSREAGVLLGIPTSTVKTRMLLVLVVGTGTRRRS